MDISPKMDIFSDFTTSNTRQKQKEKIPNEITKKNNNKKIALVLSGLAVASVAAVAIAKRKDIAPVLKDLKSKCADSANNIKNKKVKQTGNTSRNILDSKSIIPENVELPLNGKYDLSKEGSAAFLQTHNGAVGFSNVNVLGKNGDKFILEMSDAFESNGNLGDFGITSKGHPYVRLGPDNCKGKLINNMDWKSGQYVSITLASPDSNFTPAQKNLISLIIQHKGKSENSMYNITTKNKEQSPSLDEIFDIIANWSKDIDVNDETTKKVLGSLKDIKKGTGRIFVNNQLLRAC